MHHEQFRNLFLAEARAELQEGFAEACDHLIYEPVPTLESAPGAADSSSFFQALRATYAQVKAEDLYGAAKQHPAVPEGSAADHLLALAERDGEPLTVFVVPGVLAEFIETRAFEEIFEQGRDSRLAKEWSAARPHGVTMTAGDETLPLSELISTASIDEDGRSLARVFLFNVLPLSLESVGPIEDRARRFTERMEACFQLLGGPPKNLVLLGYSRGTALALEMAAAARRNRADWLGSLRAVVGVGGVIYGSAMADEIDKPGSAAAEQMRLLRTLIDRLDPAPDWRKLWWFSPFGLLGKRSRNSVIRHNTLAWLGFFKGMIAVQWDAVDDLPLKKIIAQTKEQLRASARVDMRPNLRLISELWEEFRLTRALLLPFDRQYAFNVSRFREVADAVITGLSELKLSARLAWWGSRLLPAQGVTYYAVTATMAEQEDLRDHEACCVPGSLDHLTLAKSYVDFASSSGLYLNDSQVSVESARFWPEALPLLNPEQEAIDTRFLGVLGAGHWALALRSVNQDEEGIDNPYPRIALFRALIGTVARDLEA